MREGGPGEAAGDGVGVDPSVHKEARLIPVKHSKIEELILWTASAMFLSWPLWEPSFINHRYHPHQQNESRCT